MMPSSTDGWFVPIAWRVATTVVCAPTAAVGLLLTLSFFWTVTGLPILAFAVLGIRGVFQTQHIGTPHPAWPIVGLAATEATLALGALVVVPFPAAIPIVAVLGTAAAVTASLAWMLVNASLPYPSPPPPLAPSWHRPSSPTS